MADLTFSISSSVQTPFFSLEDTMAQKADGERSRTMPRKFSPLLQRSDHS